MRQRAERLHAIMRCACRRPRAAAVPAPDGLAAPFSERRAPRAAPPARGRRSGGGPGAGRRIAAQAHDGDGGVGQAGEVAGQPSAADPGAVIVVGGVADVVEARFDLPVAAVDGEHFGGAGPFGRQRGEAVRGLPARPAGLDDGAASDDAERLAASRQGGRAGVAAVERDEGIAPTLAGGIHCTHEVGQRRPPHLPSPRPMSSARRSRTSGSAARLCRCGSSSQGEDVTAWVSGGDRDSVPSRRRVRRFLERVGRAGCRLAAFCFDQWAAYRVEQVGVPWLSRVDPFAGRRCGGRRRVRPARLPLPATSPTCGA